MNRLTVLLCLLLCSSIECISKRPSSSGKRFVIRRSTLSNPISNFLRPLKPITSLFGSGSSSNGGNNGNDNYFDIIASDDNDKNNKHGGAMLFLTKLFESYNDVLEKSPYLTKIITSGVIGGTGDILIQNFEMRKSKKSFDYRRLLVFFTVTALYIAPVINVWFNWLNNGMPLPPGLTNVARAGIMMIADQTIGAVGVTVGFFYAFELANKIFPPYNMSNKETFWDAGTKSTKNNLWETLVANWYCWPVINFVNFLVVPLQYRVLVSNLAAVFWNMFLSNVANRAAPEVQANKKK